MLLLAAALLAQPVEAGLPLWLVGTWCPAYWGEPEPPVPVKAAPLPYLELPSVREAMNGLGPTCLSWEVAGGTRLRGTEGVRFSGIPDIERTMVIEPVGRRLQFRSSFAQGQLSPARWSPRYAEASRGASEIVFEARRRGEVTRVRLIREGDRLKIEEPGEEPEPRTYRRWTR